MTIQYRPLGPASEAGLGAVGDAGVVPVIERGVLAGFEEPHELGVVHLGEEDVTHRHCEDNSDDFAVVPRLLDFDLHEHLPKYGGG